MTPEDKLAKYREFVQLVQAMRQAQVKYFYTRNPSWLSKAKALEKQVDEWRMEPGVKQQSMFS